MEFKKALQKFSLFFNLKLMKTDEGITFEIRFEELSVSLELNRELVGRLKQ